MIDSRTLADSLIQLSKEHGEEKGLKLFSQYLTDKNLIGLLPQILHHIKQLSQQKNEDMILTISSKYELSKSEIQQIQKIAQADDTNIVVETIIDPDVIGGFSAEFRGYLYNGSLENTLSQFKKALIA